jgi:hypothetical protein
MPNFENGLRIESKDASSLSSENLDILKKGFTQKTMMFDQNGHPYLAKSPDPLTAKEVFTGYLPEGDISECNARLQSHVFSLEFEGAFLEMLAPNLMKALFGDLLAVPEVYLHVTEKQEIILLSKLMDGFDEFLHRKVSKNFGTLLDAAELPKRAQINLNKEEAYFIGQLYAAALIFNHWDILNSKLLNSGVVHSNGLSKAAIVDFGFICHLSYKGRHNDSLSLRDENFVHGKRVEYCFFTKQYLQNYRHRFALPFDSKVGTLLPHTLIEDLFDIAGEDPISKKMREGFRSMVEKASKTIESDPAFYEKVFQYTLSRISTDSAIPAKDLGQFMNMCFYHGPLGKDNLCTILTARVHDCQRLLQHVNRGTTMLAQHEQARDEYVSRNTLGKSTYA